MALTYTADRPELIGGKRRVTGTITFDSSYPTGGEAFSPSAVGLFALTDLQVRPGLASATTALVPVWDRSVSAPKIVVMWGDNNNAADAALIEVADTTNIAGLVCSFEASGY